jgi:hypothetical protein
MALIIDVTAANTFFDTRLFSTAWDTSDNDIKLAALTTAQNQLEQVYVLEPTEQSHKDSVCEQALFLLVAGAGSDQRAYLQAMGVEETMRQEEKFKKDGGELAICPFARRALASAEKPRSKSKILQHDLLRDDSGYNAEAGV